jgi:hypothetical protein
MPKKINKKQAVALLEYTVQRVGADTVYADRETTVYGCRYTTEDGTPLCIIGEIFISELGLDWEPLVDVNKDDVRTATDAVYPGMFSKKAVEILQMAQDQQDSGSSWGHALEKAQSLAKSL